MSRAWCQIVLTLMTASTLLGQESPLRMARSAWLHLHVDKHAPPLEEVTFSAGKVNDASWLKDEAESKRLKVLGFSVDWWRWQEGKIEFTPAANQEVTLKLTGSFLQQDGLSVRQEVLWQKITASGTQIVNGDFKQGTKGWKVSGPAYPAPADWPLLGEDVGASWNGRHLSQTLRVTKGRRVVLKLQARAATLPDFVAPKTLPARTPAHHAAARLRRGMNVSNGWETKSGTWGRPHSLEDLEAIAAAGFDHVRIPVAWHHRIHGGRLDADFMAVLEPYLKHALDLKLVVLLDWHNFTEFCQDAAAHRDAFAEGWGLLARHFRAWPPTLWLELLNEPLGELSGETLNGVYAAAIRKIRAEDAERILVVSPEHPSAVPNLGLLRLPEDEDRVIVSVHTYTPFYFTHQGASWSGLQNLKGVVFPGPPATPLAAPPEVRREGFPAWLDDYNRLPASENPSSAHDIERELTRAAEWGKHFGRPVHLGEFGVLRVADLDSRQRYARAVARLSESLHIPWCWWEWRQGFSVIDPETGQPDLLEALMGKP